MKTFIVQESLDFIRKEKFYTIFSLEDDTQKTILETTSSASTILDKIKELSSGSAINISIRSPDPARRSYLLTKVIPQKFDPSAA